MKIFEARTVVPATMAQMIAFHGDPRALGWLTPPPIIMRIQHDTRSSLTEGDLEFTLWFLFVPVRWTARHEPGSTETSFRDRMLRGPMRFWLHEHRFEEVDDGIELVDHVTYEHKRGWQGVLTRLVFDGLPLRLLFFYRHLRTRQLAPQQPTKMA